MSTINILDEKTINKIAAGEVIERPASVIKELVENSIDSGANKIEITIADGGKEKIIVEDNGSGMDADDTRKSILRHATSKIKEYHDIFETLSMGFRGEALSSVAAVSELVITTRQKDSELGFKLKVSGGKDQKEESDIVCNPGTKITVNNLFYNVPARSKFLKGRIYEQRLITDIITRYALIHNNISFILKNEESTLIEKPASNNIKENMVAIYGWNTAKESFEVKDDFVEGIIIKPTINRSSRDYMSIYVNSRFIKSKIIEDAIMDALDTLLFHDRYPIVVLNLNIDPNKIDVNVHPSKKIIKFDDETAIYQKVFDAIKEAISKSDLFENRSEEKEASQETLYPVTESESKVIKEESGKYFESNSEVQSSLATESAEKKITPKTTFRKDINIIGQIHKTYIIIETKEGYALVDQHAAEERINYNKIKAQMDAGKIGKQTLLGGKAVNLTATEMSEIDEAKNQLKDFGFMFEDFGKDCIIVKEIPSTLNIENNLKNTLLTLAKKMQENRNISIDEKKESSIKYMACRSSIKAGEVLNMAQMKSLVDELMEADNCYTCPHGRPTMLKYPLKSIEKDFKRIE